MELDGREYYINSSAWVSRCSFNNTGQCEGLKTWSSYLLLVPRLEAFALPGIVERATRNPRRWIYIVFPTIKFHTLFKTQCISSKIGMLIKTSHGHLPLPCSDNTWELRSSKTSKRSAKVNAFLYVLFPSLPASLCYAITGFTRFSTAWVVLVVLLWTSPNCIEHKTYELATKLHIFSETPFFFYEILPLGYLIYVIFNEKIVKQQ